LHVEGARESFSVPVTASDDAAALGPHELVVIAVKAHALAAAAPALAPLVGPQTVLLPAMNGVPWWFLPAALPDQLPLASVDPGGELLARLPLERVLGCVVHLAASSPAPGRIRHAVGEPRGGTSARVVAVCAALAEAGFQAEASADVRGDVWYKLWGNMTMNPVSALTGATLDRVLADDLLREFCSRAMQEAAEVGARIGCAVRESAADRHAVTARLGAFKTSMLQDAEAGRTLELDALVGVVREIGARVAVATPNIDALFALARLFGRVRGIYPA
ncbi:MAG: 2-dehydropantoate 2-reductase, partial [Gammaproteobacteria bacterium]|nr:2-dehydropantoate 2-reductase [Gammaproteobacteria bacterium]